MIGGGGDGNMHGANHCAFRQECVAFGEIYPRLADMARGFIIKQRGKDIVLTLRIFLNDDMVCPFGDSSACKDTHGLAHIDCAFKGVTCGRISNNGELNACFADIREFYRVTIHCGGGQGRQSDFGFDVFS